MRFIKYDFVTFLASELFVYVGKGSPPRAYHFAGIINYPVQSEPILNIEVAISGDDVED